MAKCICVYSRNKNNDNTLARLTKVCNSIAPDNIDANAPIVNVNGNVAYGIMNPVSTIDIGERHVLMGSVFSSGDDWKKPNTDFPDGSYAVLRYDEVFFEAVTDCVGSRTIWYFLDEDYFIASTSQRAIVLFLGTFEFNESVVPWVLSSGTLGPNLSWDKRIKQVPVNSSVILNTKSWSLEVKSEEMVPFSSGKGTEMELKQKLQQSLLSNFKSLNLDYNNWSLPLSGGFDSRAILCLLHKTSDISGLKTITWGLEASLKDKDNDAFIARQLADEFNVENKYLLTNFSNEPIERLLHRYFLNGEGRIDHVSGYMDGFNVWKLLFEEGVQGTIRGDESFGHRKVSNKIAVKFQIGIILCEDYSNLREYVPMFAPQEIPDNLKQKNNESLEKWRDRLYQEYRIPTIMSSLADLKLSYVEQISPFLSKKIIEEVRKFPSKFRTAKALFRKVMFDMGPDIPYATTDAVAQATDILKHEHMVSFLKDQLDSKEMMDLFPEELVKTVKTKMKSQNEENIENPNKYSIKRILKKITPYYVKDFLRNHVDSATVLDYNQLAFRLYTILHMKRILDNDAIR